MPAAITCTFDEYFWSKVIKTDGCWIWSGPISVSKTRGRMHGNVEFKGKTQTAHKAAYELVIGPVPYGKELHHVCKNKTCVRLNENHVIAITRLEHARLEPGGRKPQQFCQRGHEFTVENTYIATRKGKPYKSCRKCKRQWQREKRLMCRQCHPK
jgi:hypothetical protein